MNLAPESVALRAVRDRGSLPVGVHTWSAIRKLPVASIRGGLTRDPDRVGSATEPDTGSLTKSARNDSAGRRPRGTSLGRTQAAFRVVKLGL